MAVDGLAPGPYPILDTESNNKHAKTPQTHTTMQVAKLLGGPLQRRARAIRGAAQATWQELAPLIEQGEKVRACGCYAPPHQT